MPHSINNNDNDSDYHKKSKKKHKHKHRHRQALISNPQSSSSSSSNIWMWIFGGFTVAVLCAMYFYPSFFFGKGSNDDDDDDDDDGTTDPNNHFFQGRVPYTTGYDEEYYAKVTVNQNTSKATISIYNSVPTIVYGPSQVTLFKILAPVGTGYKPDELETSFADGDIKLNWKNIKQSGESLSLHFESTSFTSTLAIGNTPPPTGKPTSPLIGLWSVNFLNSTTHSPETSTFKLNSDNTFEFYDNNHDASYNGTFVSPQVIFTDSLRHITYTIKYNETIRRFQFFSDVLPDLIRTMTPPSN